MSTQVRKCLLSSVTGEQQDCCGSSHTVIPINILAASAIHLGKYLKAVLLPPPHICHQLSHAFLSLYPQKANSKQMSNSILNLFHGNFFLTCFFLCDMFPVLLHSELPNAATTARGETRWQAAHQQLALSIASQDGFLERKRKQK